MSCKDCCNFEPETAGDVTGYCDVQGEEIDNDGFCMSYLWRDDRKPLPVGVEDRGEKT
jgi:hypothetical protein